MRPVYLFGKAVESAGSRVTCHAQPTRSLDSGHSLRSPQFGPPRFERTVTPGDRRFAALCDRVGVGARGQSDAPNVLA